MCICFLLARCEMTLSTWHLYQHFSFVNANEPYALPAYLPPLYDAHRRVALVLFNIGSQRLNE